MVENPLLLSLLLWLTISVLIGGVCWLRNDSLLFPHEGNRSQRSSLLPNAARPSNATIDHSDKSSSWPQIVWLMSFPNSGTSYTLRLVQQMSRQTTATNYAKEHTTDNSEHDNDSSNSTTTMLLIRDDWKHGPYRSNPALPLPPRYILTKTHCGGRCVHCGPDRYLENYRSFQQACLRGDGKNRSDRITVTPPPYAASLVTRAVHLIRHPMDNIVSRFHLDRLQQQQQEQFVSVQPNQSTQSTATSFKYPNNRTGFQQWCRDMDQQYRSMELHFRWIDDRVRNAFRQVPCHAEFFKYVQWHNLATMTMTQTMKLQQTMIMYYEDYYQEQQYSSIKTLQGTAKHRSAQPPLQPPAAPRQVQALMEFLHVQAVDWNATPWFEPKTYVTTYYTEQQRQSIRNLVQELATAATWELLQRYF